ncbi:MAG TPA: hypothetical protein PLE61_11885 [Vicinamibacterales bacterium]|nr:hypothetical protein [Vicinamibacterales bacterium]HPW21502.1 hypothetical protein [Vicinamibacterales bacterium]
MPSSGSPRRQRLSLAAVILGAAIVPFGLRAVNAVTRPPGAEPSYIPSVESPRVRGPFDREAVEALREAANDVILIGDSMAGTRIHPGHLSRLMGGRGAAALFHPGSGPAYWYLTFKNLVVNAGLHPRTAVFFFRDENLTDTLFRVYPSALDRVARQREPVLDELLAARANGRYFRVHRILTRLYGHDQARAWLEPLIVRAPVAWSATRRARKRLLERINNEVFTLDALRPMAAADMASASGEALDFRRNLPTSVLPEILRLSHSSGIRVAFVRVQRRPGPDGPPPQSAALRAYVGALRAYLEENGALFHDDWGDPDQPLSIYEDGDHIAREYRLHCTELFFRKNPEVFR